MAKNAKEFLQKYANNNNENIVNKAELEKFTGSDSQLKQIIADSLSTNNKWAFNGKAVEYLRGKGFQPPDFSEYVNHPDYTDLKNAFEKYKRNGGKKTKAEWGKRHWVNTGKAEGRTKGFYPQISDAQTFVNTYKNLGGLKRSEMRESYTGDYADLVKEAARQGETFAGAALEHVRDKGGFGKPKAFFKYFGDEGISKGEIKDYYTGDLNDLYEKVDNNNVTLNEGAKNYLANKIDITFDNPASFLDFYGGEGLTKSEIEDNYTGDLEKLIEKADNKDISFDEDAKDYINEQLPPESEYASYSNAAQFLNVYGADGKISRADIENHFTGNFNKLVQKAYNKNIDIGSGAQSYITNQLGSYPQIEVEEYPEVPTFQTTDTKESGILKWKGNKNTWLYSDLKEDHRTDYKTDRAIKREVVKTDFYFVRTEKTRWGTNTIVARDIITNEIFPDGTKQEKDRETFEGTGYFYDPDNRRGRPGSNPTYSYFSNENDSEDFESEYDSVFYDVKRWNDDNGKAAKKANEEGEKLNKENVVRNENARNINTESRNIVQLANNTQGNDYIQQRTVIEAIKNKNGITDDVKNNFKDQFRQFYLDEKIVPFDTRIAAKDPTGNFDASYYLTNYEEVKEAWDREVANDNLDVIATVGFSETAFAEKHYTEYGQFERRRGSKEEETTAANAYKLKAPTDLEKANILDKQLGLDETQEEPLNERLREDKRVVKLWEEVREGGNDYYDAKKEELGLDLQNFNDFALAFLSEINNDTQTSSIKDQLLADEILVEGEEYITDLEDALTRSAGDAAREQTKDFGALTQSVLKDTLDRLEQAKQMEANFDLYSGFSDFGEVMDPGANLTNSILGDSGIGGYLGFIGGPEYAESLEEGINRVFGMGNLAEVNWQKWFDETLTEKYAAKFEEKFRDLEFTRNILEAAGPNSRDFVAYVNTNEDLAENYVNYIRKTPEAERLTKAEWGARNFKRTGGKGEDISALQKNVWNAENNSFTDNFLADSFFRNTKEVSDFLTSVEGGEELLTQITSPTFDSLSLIKQIKDVNQAIEDVDRGKYDLTLDTELGEEVIEAQFARDFITDFVRPRFNQSKSIAEFRDYINVDPRYQTPFQMQNIIDALKTTAQERAQYYMDQVNGAIDQNFDAAYYEDPTEGFGKGTGQAIDLRTNLQKQTVEQDYQNALDGKLSGTIDWRKEMYRYAVPIKYSSKDPIYEGVSGYYRPIKEIDKAAFMRMHYEVKGKFGVEDENGNKIIFTPAKNVADPERIKRYVYYEVMPMLEDEAIDIGSIFGEFVTPEQFADDVISSFDLATDEEVAEILAKYGLEGADAGIEELRETLVEMIASNDALAIRQGIKDINEQGLRPDQQNLGVTYIEREEDYDPEIKGESQLFKAFQSVGFKGTEQEFYDEFMPDADQEELRFLEDSMKGLNFDAGDFSDPFSMLATADSYFPDEDESLSSDFGGPDLDDFATRYKNAYTTDRFFNVGKSTDTYGSDYDDLYENYPLKKTKAGSNFLEGFTRGFARGADKKLSVF